MNCPACDIELKMAERQGVEIDYCPQCRGVWLDRGELDKIIERATSMSFGEDLEEDREERKRYGPKGYKRKSFWGNLFDFD